MIADHAARVFRAKPTADSLSMDPSDGGGWCECPDCAKLGSVSTRVAILANVAAESANGLDLGPKYVGLYAYNQHAAPPAVDIHPNVIPSATTAFIGGGLSYDEVVRGWQAKGATMGTYDYLSVVAWDWNLPRGGAAHDSPTSRACCPRSTAWASGSTTPRPATAGGRAGSGTTWPAASSGTSARPNSRPRSSTTS